MSGFLSHLANTAVAMLDRAQPNFNGGIFAYFGNSFDLSSNVTFPSVSQYLKHVLLSNGFFWALLCGALWIMTILLIAVGLACLHCRRNGSSKITLTYRQVAWRLQRLEHRRRTSAHYKITQLMLFGVILILCVTPLILAFAANAQLNFYLRASPDSNNEAGLFPQLNVAVERVVQFMRRLAPHARIASKPAVDETIRRTLQMADKTREIFQAAYKGELGVTDLMKTTNRLTDCLTENYFGFQNFSAELFDPLKGGARMSALNSLKQLNIIKYYFTDAMNAFNSLKNLCLQNNQIQCDQFGDLLLSTIALFRDDQLALNNIASNAITFVNALSQAGQTPDKIKEKAEEGARTSESMTVSMNARFDKELNSTELILNTTNSKWDLMESSMIQLERSILEATEQLFKKARQQVNKYERIRNALFVVCLVLLLGVFLFAIYVSFCGVMFESLLTKWRHFLKCCNLLLFGVLAINVLLATTVFLTAGFLQTDVCRYLQEKPSAFAVNNPSAFNSTLQLDIVVNNFIKRNWKTIEDNMKKQNSSSAFPLPKPRDPFYGLNTVCQNDGSIMVAINALESFDAASMNDPKPMQEFLAKGKQLLATVLNETDSAALLPSDTENNLKQLNQSATLFIASNDYDKALEILEKPLLSTDLHTIQRNWTSLEIKLDQPKMLTNEHSNSMAEVSRQLEKAVKSFKEMENARQHLVKTIKTLKKNKDIFSIIRESVQNFRMVKNSTTNKTHMIGVAMKYYSAIIEKETLLRAVHISTFSAFAIMKVVGPCRPLYEAFVAVTSAVCDTTVPPLAVFYFTIGWSLFLATSLLMALAFVLSKHIDVENDMLVNGNATKSPLSPENTVPMLSNEEDKLSNGKVNGKETQL